MTPNPSLHPTRYVFGYLPAYFLDVSGQRPADFGIEVAEMLSGDYLQFLAQAGEVAADAFADQPVFVSTGQDTSVTRAQNYGWAGAIATFK